MLLFAGAVATFVWSFDRTPQIAITDRVTPIPSPSPTPEPLLVHVLSGPVYVKEENATQEATIVEDTSIEEGARVRTGDTGRAEIRYPNDSVTRMNYNSEVLVKEFSSSPQNSLVELLQGSIWSRVTKLLGQESFQTETEGVVASVRGTAYRMSLLPNGAREVMVAEGLVNVQPDATTEAFPVAANTQITLNSKPNSVPVIRTIQEDQNNDEWTKFNLEKDSEMIERKPDRFSHAEQKKVLGTSTASGQEKKTGEGTDKPGRSGNGNSGSGGTNAPRGNGNGADTGANKSKGKGQDNAEGRGGGGRSGGVSDTIQDILPTIAPIIPTAVPVIPTSVPILPTTPPAAEPTGSQNCNGLGNPNCNGEPPGQVDKDKDKDKDKVKDKDKNGLSVGVSAGGLQVGVQLGGN